jgi:uncharacterized membrane protein
MSARYRLAALWRDLPFAYLWLAPLAVLDLEVAELGRPVLPALAAFLPPFAVGCVALRRAPAARPPMAAVLAVSAAAVAAILLGWTGPQLDPETLFRLTEWTAAAAFLLLGAHAWRVAPPGTAPAIFGVGLLYGLILENGGVALGFFAEDGFHLRLPGFPAPIATTVGWCLVFYPLWATVPRLAGARAGPGRRAAVATAIALLQDLQLDPPATAAGFWVWHPSLPPQVRGVPVVNFTAWFSAVLPFAWAAFAATRDGRLDAGRLARRLPAVLVAALVLVLAVTAAAEAPIGWPSLALFAGAARRLP